MKRLFIVLALCAALLLPLLAVSGQGTGVFAEAKIEANLRSAIGIETDVIGQITAGTRYPVIGRSEFFPWILIGDANTAQPLGWVFLEIVNVYGDLNVVPLTDAPVSAQPTPTPPAPTTDPVAAGQPPAEVTPPPTPSPTPAFSVYGEVSGEINLRYGPGVNYPRVGVVRPGERLEIIGYHTQFEWVLVRFPGAPNNEAWVALNLLTVQGDVYSTQAVARTDFSSLPTLTPTPAVLAGSGVRRDGTPVPLSPEFEALGNILWNQVLTAGFDPATSRFGALYIQNLETGEEMTFGNNFAFSGTSITKVGILMALYEVMNQEPDPQMAVDIANMMICSENVATNRLISAVGGGDVYLGSEYVTAFMERLGMTRTFLTAPYEILNATPIPPPRPIRYPDTDADQTKANPNLTNQMTVDDMGHMLASLYQCGMQETGPLLTEFNGFTPQECRKMLHVMANNNVDALLKAGVPEDIAVAHKHGWVADTHGNAAIFFTPSADYVIVMMLHEPSWLVYEQSLPVIANVSRTVFNFFNPDRPLDQVREGFIPDATTCNFASSPLIGDIVSPGYGLVLPFDPLPIGAQ